MYIIFCSIVIGVLLINIHQSKLYCRISTHLSFPYKIPIATIALGTEFIMHTNISILTVPYKNLPCDYKTFSKSQ